MGCIVTYSPRDKGLGRAYDPVAAPELLPDLYAAAVASCRICRYGGHLLTSARRPWHLLRPGDPGENRLGDGLYSVGQHSLILSYLVPPPLALEALVHDLAEGLGMFDLQAPIKVELPGYCAIEDNVGRAVDRKLGINGPSSYVKAWDKNLVWTERRDLHGATEFEWSAPPGALLLPLRIRPMTPMAAARAWLARYEEVRKGRNPGPARARYNRLRYALGVRTMYTGIELFGIETATPSGSTITWPERAWLWA